MFSTKRVVAATVIAAGMQVVSAQSLSSQCQATLAQLVTSPETKCLNAQSLVGIVVSGSNTSVISPVNSWLTGLCAQPACTNETLAAVVGNITNGCSSDLQSYGFSSGNSSELTSLVQTAYPTARQVACLADTSNSKTLCVTETLNNLQPYTGTLTPSKVESLVSQIASGNVPNVPSNVTCTDCTKAALNIVNQNLPGVISSGTNSSITGQCGNSFVDGAQPSTITQTANTAIASSSSNGASSLAVSMSSVLGITLSSLLAVSSALAILA
ncbi:hypothetical protein AcW1_003748 [Taiwanofungus camphoratus]|nr:hypothetical protein AcW1_003748 [Antrodia cinnamomea]KAI0958233.1 hypothetical protein AcV7_004106 [Antrodia cinnamomea]